MPLGTSQENVHFFSFFSKITHFSIKLSCFIPTPYTLHPTLVQFLRFRSLVPYLLVSCKRPTKNQGRTKDEPKNSKTQKSTLTKPVTKPEKG